MCRSSVSAILRNSSLDHVAIAGLLLSPRSSGLNHDLDRLASVHRAVAGGNLVEADDPIEDAAGLYPALEDVGKQLIDVRADRGGTAADRDVVVERRLRGRDRLVMGDTHAADGATGQSDADRGKHGLVGAYALEDGVDPCAAGQVAHALDCLLAALAHDVRCAEISRQRDAIRMAAQEDDLLGTQAAGGG